MDDINGLTTGEKVGGLAGGLVVFPAVAAGLTVLAVRSIKAQDDWMAGWGRIFGAIMFTPMIFGVGGALTWVLARKSNPWLANSALVVGLAPTAVAIGALVLDRMRPPSTT